MNRLLYRLYLLLGSMGHWLRRRLTPGGWLILVGMVAAAGLGADPDRAIAYQSFAILFALLGLAMLCALWFRVRLVIRRVLPRFGTVGQPLQYPVVIRNESARAEAGLCLLENLANAPITYEEFLGLHGPSESKHSFQLTRTPPFFRAAILKPTHLPPLAPRAETSVTAEVTPLRRGPLQFAGLTVARPDPLGLFRAFSNLPAVQSVLVLPKRYPLPPIPLPGSRKYQLGGVSLAMSVGESEEFVSLRDYRRGDPLRHIHWKSWAKTGKPIVREFEDEYFVRHALILDTFAGKSQWDCFEEAVSVAASFACTVNTQESLLDLIFVGPEAFCFTAGRGLAHSDQMLEILASVQPCQDKSFAELQTMVLKHSELVSGCICVFLAWDKARQELVRRLQSVGVPLLVFVVVPPGESTSIPRSPSDPQPEFFHVLEAGKIQEGLQTL